MRTTWRLTVVELGITRSVTSTADSASTIARLSHLNHLEQV